MQNFDPKLFESQNQPARKQTNTSSERAVRRTDRVDDDDKNRKKFRLDEKKTKSKGSEESKKELSKSDLPSAFSLASRGALKDSTEKESDDSSGDERFSGKDENSDEKSTKSDDTHKVVNPITSKLESVKGEMKAEAVSKSAKAARTQLEQLLKTVVDSITQMKLEGKSETTVVIKHPPLFANAKLTLTSFDTAKGEFNITFSELNAKAKDVLDMQMSRESLARHLEEKGYVTHILVATTEKEETLLTAAEADPREKQEGGEQQKDKGEEEKREKRR